MALPWRKKGAVGQVVGVRQRNGVRSRKKRVQYSTGRKGYQMVRFVNVILQFSKKLKCVQLNFAAVESEH